MFGMAFVTRLIVLTGLALSVVRVSSAQWINVEPYELPRPGSGPNGITLGPDGAVWFTEMLNNTIGRITADGALTEFPLPTNCGVPYGCGPAAITAGPDGALWFVEAFVGRIGRISTAGAVTEYDLSHPAGQITAGPDGALWFTTESSNNKIGRITVDGVVTTYDLPTDCNDPVWGCGLQGIVAGPDGALWFTEYEGDKIGRITTSGTITEFPLLRDGAYPQGITVGSDGALWFTEEGGAAIGRITTSGVISRYSTGGLPNPDLIAAGPDGALWFTDQANDGIGRITTAGVATVHRLPPTTSPYGITAGPDGALWMTTIPNGNSILRVPVCHLDLSAALVNTTLYLHLTLSTARPGTLSLGYSSQGTVTGLWSKSIPAVVPQASFGVPWGPGFPATGSVTVMGALKDEATSAFLCADWQVLDAGRIGAIPE